jgi:hypothetical protein
MVANFTEENDRIISVDHGYTTYFQNFYIMLLCKNTKECPRTFNLIFFCDRAEARSSLNESRETLQVTRQ